MPRRREIEGQRARLSAAVWAVLAEQGPQGLSLRAVAERAACTTGLVLHTFRDKRALLAHAREVLHERTAQSADAAETGTPAEALHAVLLQAASLTPQAREEARVWLGFLAAALGDTELAELHVRGNRAFVERVTRLVGAVRPELDAAHVRAHALALVALVEGLNSLATVDEETYAPDAQRAAVDVALAGLLAPG
ncbi:TetR/AcrR family transcriptional regulator [Motilibacter aurantiacus]|uniref:TetR/AcrR family transcriptional regulator n=1 Tax=Motilibacter aurantiacus TaxID=2714955 RepID=UPI00140C2F86|nr:TetR family transcriptional regulator [Motilibacter aurantiacus]